MTTIMELTDNERDLLRAGVYALVYQDSNPGSNKELAEHGWKYPESCEATAKKLRALALLAARFGDPETEKRALEWAEKWAYCAERGYSYGFSSGERVW